MIRDFTLKIQKGLTIDEQNIAKKYFEWFIDHAYSGKQRFDLKSNKWILGGPVPSWKHMTRGGHQHGTPLGRNEFGVRCDWLAAKDNEKETGKSLVFRRHGKTKRLFVVQRISNMIVLEESENTHFCSCRQCDGGKKSRSKLTEKDFDFVSYHN
jgi:hypothetical protein